MAFPDEPSPARLLVNLVFLPLPQVLPPVGRDPQGLGFTDHAERHAERRRQMCPRQRHAHVGGAVVQAVGPTLRNFIGDQRRVFFVLFRCWRGLACGSLPSRSQHADDDSDPARCVRSVPRFPQPAGPRRSLTTISSSLERSWRGVGFGGEDVAHLNPLLVPLSC